MAFNGFLPAVQKAQRKGQVAKDDPLGQAAYDASAELALALQDRDLQRAADRHAGGDRELLHKMWMSGELAVILRAGGNRESCTASTVWPSAMSALLPVHPIPAYRLASAIYDYSK